MNTPLRHMPGLDGVRGIAVLLVVASHFLVVGDNLDESHPFGRLLLSGHLGVELFFVLSGFLITAILMRAKGREGYFRAFYMRRLLRIFPLYYLVLALAFLSVPWLSPGDAERLRGVDSPWWFWGYASNLGVAFKGDWLASPQWFGLRHFWSLAVEEQFYLVWPMVVWLLPGRWLGRLCLVLVATHPAVLAWLHATFGQTSAYVSTLGRLGPLALGAWLALVWTPERASAWSGRAGWLLGLSLGLLLLERSVLPGLAPLESSLVLAASVALVVLAAACSGGGSPTAFTAVIDRACGSCVLRWFGKYSYGIYVWHYALKPVWMEFLWERLARPLAGGGWAGTLVFTLLAGAASAALAWASWHLMEKRLLALKRHFTYRVPQEA
jgi:peptidoglycan/LPS O-acetylase OafA/YrhL